MTELVLKDSPTVLLKTLAFYEGLKKQESATSPEPAQPQVQQPAHVWGDAPQMPASVVQAQQESAAEPEKQKTKRGGKKTAEAEPVNAAAFPLIQPLPGSIAPFPGALPQTGASQPSHVPVTNDPQNQWMPGAGQVAQPFAPNAASPFAQALPETQAVAAAAPFQPQQAPAPQPGGMLTYLHELVQPYTMHNAFRAKMLEGLNYYGAQTLDTLAPENYQAFGIYIQEVIQGKR